MEPPVIAFCKLKGKLFVLEVILSDIHMIAIAGNVMKRFAFVFHFLFREFAPYISCCNQFVFDCIKVIFILSNVQCVHDRFQINNFIFRFLDQ